MKAKVYVTLKEGVLDPQGRAVLHGLHTLGYNSVSDVRVGRYFEVEVAPGTAQAEVEKMCDQLLANPVIEDFRVELDQ